MHVREVGELLSKRIEDVTATNRRLGSYQAVILAAMDLADELLRTRTSQMEIRREVNRSSRDLIRLVDDMLDGPAPV